MARFQVAVKVGPPHLFGLPDPNVQALPPGTTPVLNWDTTSMRTWTELPDGSDPYRKDENRLLFAAAVDGVALSADDNVFQVQLDASDEDEAASRAAAIILQLFHLRATVSRPGVHRITATAITVQRIPSGVRRLSPDVSRVYVYELGELRQTLGQAAEMLDWTLGDPRMEQALRYFGLGDDLSTLIARNTDEQYAASLAPLRFLQYWKALATIVGERSRKSDANSRHINLGLERSFYRHTVDPLRDIRNRFDVAHITDPDSPLMVQSADVQRCRDAASTAIQHYGRAIEKDQRPQRPNGAMLRMPASRRP